MYTYDNRKCDKMEEKKTKKDRLYEIIRVLKNNNILSGITPEKIRKILEDLGPTFIKIGQIMASRTDWLPEDYIKELSKLRSEVTPMPFAEVEKILNNEYQTEIFESINPHSIGSGSIAQVHKAILKNKEEVVIKVQRTNIKEKMALDIELLKQALSILHIDNLIQNTIDINSFLDELYESAKEEMDFQKEASYMELFQKNNQAISYIQIPKVYKELTTPHILVMEYVRGVHILDKIELEYLGYHPAQIARVLANSYIKQAIYDGLFQADPHPDNFMIANDKIIYLDFGMMGNLENKEKRILQKCMKNIVKKDYFEIVENIIELCGATATDHTNLEKQVKTILDQYGNTPLNDISAINFFYDMYHMLKENNIKLPKTTTLMIRGIIVLEGLLKELDPTISLFQVLATQVTESEIQKLKNGETIFSSLKQLSNTATSISKIPQEILTLVRNLNNGETNFSIELQNSNKQVDKLEMMLHQLIVGLLDVAFILGASLMARDNNILLRNIYLAIAFALSIWLLIKMVIDHKTKGM